MTWALALESKFLVRTYGGTGVDVTTHRLGGVGVGVPVRMTSAVASIAWAVAVAQFSGLGVAVTMIGVTQFGGRGVGVPVVVAQAVAVSALAAAVTTFPGMGSGVVTT